MHISLEKPSNFQVIKIVHTKTLTHQECIHFSNGVCTFYNIPVDPNQPACPNFTPKTAASITPIPAIPFKKVGLGYGSVPYRRYGWGRGLRYRMGWYQPTHILQKFTQDRSQEILMLERWVEILQQKLNQIREKIRQIRRF